MRHLIWFALSGRIICFSTGQWPNTPPSCVRAIWKRRVIECGIRWPGLHNHPTSSNWDGLGWVGPQSEEKAANKCSAYVGTPSRLLEKHSSWSWMRECQEHKNMSSRQRVATLKKIYFDLFNTFLVTTWFHMCYFIVLMSSLLFYNLENSTNKEKPLNE